MRPWTSASVAAVLLLSACAPSGPPAPTTSANAAETPAPVAVVSPAVAPAASPAAAGSPSASASPGLAASPGVAASPVAAPLPTLAPTLPPAGAQEVTINALQGEPDTIDPSRSTVNTEAAVIRQVFEPLLRFDRDLRPVPAAAASFDVSQDGKTYTFHLRPDGKFSDGTPVRAQDFEYSFKRILNPSVAAEYASFFVDAGIVGAADYNSKKVPNADNVGVKALDDLTLQIQLQGPVGYFPNLVALWVVPPLRQDIIDKAGDSWTQDPSTYIGNGPFKMTEWVHQDHISFAPNPNYWGQKPVLQKLTYLMVTSAQTDYAAYMNNERDWILVPDANVQTVKQDPTLSSQTHQYNELTEFWLQMNNARKPLDNPLVRKALSRAIDRNALIRDIANGVGLTATSFIPPGMPGYQQGLGQDIGFDPNAAKDLLRQAGYADASQFPTLSFRYATTTGNQARAEFIQAQLKQNLGVNINLDAMESKAYEAAYKAKDYDLSFGGWGADYPDPQDWLSGLFGCDASNNKYNYCDQAFDQAAKRGDTLTDQNARLEAYAQAQQILVNDLPVAPLFVRGRLVLVKPYVQNLVITPEDDFPGDFFLNLVSLRQH